MYVFIGHIYLYLIYSNTTPLDLNYHYPSMSIISPHCNPHIYKLPARYTMYLKYPLTLSLSNTVRNFRNVPLLLCLTWKKNTPRTSRNIFQRVSSRRPVTKISLEQCMIYQIEMHYLKDIKIIYIFWLDKLQSVGDFRQSLETRESAL